MHNLSLYTCIIYEYSLLLPEGNIFPSTEEQLGAHRVGGARTVKAGPPAEGHGAAFTTGTGLPGAGAGGSRTPAPLGPAAHGPLLLWCLGEEGVLRES